MRARSVAASDDSLVSIRRIAIGMVLIGGGLQGYANSTIGALPVALFFLVSGYLAVGVVFPRKRPELRVFMLTYGICILVGGLAQCYSLAVFQDPQNFSDAVYFLRQVSPKPPFRQWAEMPTDTSLAIATWQQLYEVAWLLGLKFGSYIAVMFNALVIALAGSLTVGTARALFGDDERQLRRVGLFFAGCGLFILFGSIMLRDSFVVFFNALWLWAVVRWLVRPTVRSLLLAIALTSISIYAMLFLRDEIVALFGVYIFLVGLAWYCTKKLTASRIMVVVFVLALIPLAYTYVTGYVQNIRDTQAFGQQSYANLGAIESTQNSLGMRLVADQPLPIRMVVTAGTLMINPIPLWGNFNAGASEYHWIEGYHGIYLVMVLPFGIAGLFGTVSLLRKKGRQAVPLLFLAIYLLVNLAAVTGSSRLGRHLGQFLAALTIVAALPDPQDKVERRRLRMISVAWFSGVILIHVAWAILR